MKAIELTEEHKSKLLEMCKVLFPEYVLIYWENGNGDGWADGLLSFSNDSKSSFSVHWFEFCMTHLATVIYNKGSYYKNYITITQFRGYLCQEAEHPVDYLYEEFKKLKI